MRDIQFSPDAFEEYNNWIIENKSLFNKINKLIIETARTPFEGTGKPEALKHDFKGYWSRRIDQEHRLVYRVAAKDRKITNKNFKGCTMPNC
jgi:toxin YoeB